MAGPSARLLFLTDPAYPAADRPRYGEEDLLLIARLEAWADVRTSAVPGAADLLDGVDGVVIRNCGPVLDHAGAFDRLVKGIRRRGLPCYNSLDGRGDQVGKDHLVELDAAGHPVIPTSTSAEAARRRSPEAARFMVKRRRGADSQGQQVIERDRLDAVDPTADVVVQPLLAIEREVSFMVVSGAVTWAVQTRPGGPRWALEPFTPTAEDLAFARRFVEWNPMTHGVQRIDAMRGPDGQLLLMEIEDLNPFLSLELLDADERDRVVQVLAEDVRRVLDGRR